ncbi:ABC transporter permease [Ilumatobacter sp.]|uniref:ABC transporter permease n=1 Tax=Ilumatobacter sp. TaxID=1967498 RepID=UPI003AF40C46
MKWPSLASLVIEQTRYQVLLFVRSPVGMFFTLGLPIFMLVLFNSLFGEGTVETPAGSWSVQQFYTGGLAAFTAVSATYTNLVNVVPIRRDEGILKRWRSTPIPSGVYLAGWILSAVSIAMVGVLLQLTLGVVAYDLTIEPAKVPAMIVTFVVGVSTFAALGLAIAGLVPNADSAPAVANATILPLAFISDVFIPLDDPPRWLEVLGNIFPLKPFVNAFQNTLNPLVDAPGFSWSKLAVVLAWGVGGALLATKTFTWEPSTGGGRRKRRRRRGSSSPELVQPSA